MSKNIRYFFLLAAITIIVSCKKKTPDDIGLPYVPTGDLLQANFIDTFTLITHTCKSVPLLMTGQPLNLLGATNDPIFGTTTASIFTQFEPAFYYPSFGKNITLDSVVLSLALYNNGGKYYYGALAAEKFAVYQVSDPAFNVSSPYYSNSTTLYNTEIGSAYIKPSVVSEKIGTGADTLILPPQLRIKLPASYFWNSGFLDSTNYLTPAIFQNFFKGLYITTTSAPSSGQGAILYIDLTDANPFYSHLTFYFRSSLKSGAAGPLGRDTLFNLNVNTGTCAHYSHIAHDYSNATDINTQINDKDTMHQENDVYVHTLGGVRTKITFPNLKHFFDDGKKAINKAELIMNVEPNSITGNGTNTSTFSCPNQLIVWVADSLGPLVIPDYYEGAAYFGGVYDSIKHQYTFNIARYVQQVLNGTRKAEGLYIMTTSDYTTANRVQLIGGSKALNGHMSLAITYTPLRSARSKSPVKDVSKTSLQPVQLTQKQ
jgi:hypothetical protein